MHHTKEVTCGEAADSPVAPGGRDSALDFIKGVCILLVVYSHTSRVGLWAEAQNAVVRFLYLFHMPVFIVVSGFLFGNRAGTRDAFGKVFSHILRPYLIVAPLLFVLLSLSSRLGVSTSGHAPESALGFAKSLLKGCGGGATWFLYALGVTQLVFLLADWAGRAFRLSRAAVTVLILFLFAGLFCFETRLKETFVLFFWLGILIRERHGHFPHSWLGVPLMAASGAMILWQGQLFSVAHVVLAFAVIMLLSQAAKSFTGRRFVQVGAWLGRHTMPILAFHSIFNVVFRPAVGLLLRLEPTGVLYSLLNVVFATGMCLLAEWALKRLKLYALIFG